MPVLASKDVSGHSWDLGQTIFLCQAISISEVGIFHGRVFALHYFKVLLCSLGEHLTWDLANNRNFWAFGFHFHNMVAFNIQRL
jgi:hypothetical protein